MTILPLTYLGNIEYFSALLAGGDVVIDLGENYVKQTYRNRCEIMTSGGVAALTVNVVKGGSMHKKAMRDMRIDYSKRWQHQHRVSLVSAYRNSPYFDHYWERFAPFFEKEFAFLADLNTGLLETALECLKLRPEMRYSDTYINAGPADTDMRGAFAPVLRDIVSDTDSNRATIVPGAVLPPRWQPMQSYYQVFSDRLPFAPNLSIIDLILCEGPAARDFLIRKNQDILQG